MYVLLTCLFARTTDLMHALQTYLFARAADLFVYGHSLLHSYMPDDIVGRAL